MVAYGLISSNHALFRAVNRALGNRRQCANSLGRGTAEDLRIVALGSEKEDNVENRSALIQEINKPINVL